MAAGRDQRTLKHGDDGKDTPSNRHHFHMQHICHSIYMNIARNEKKKKN